MSLQIYYGAAGSGKSTTLQNYLIEEAAKNPKKNYILLVPDQFTMQTQMDIVRKSPTGGILNIDVLSFSRLSYRVFAEAGVPEGKVLDDTGKSLVLRHVASAVSDKMPYIGRNLNKTGYVHEVKSAISEFMQYGIGYEQLQKLTESSEENLLNIKLKDLSVIYKAFTEYNKDRFITGEELLDHLCNKLPKADFIKNSVVVLDGFTGFTPVQERVIGKLMELADKVIVSFTFSGPEQFDEVANEEKLFYLSRKGTRRLKTLAMDLKVEVLEDVCISSSDKSRFAGNPEFAHLEANLFRYPYTTFAGTPSNISLFKCDDIDGEVSEIARRIRQLIETGEYAYRDIAVVVGDLEAYGLYFETRMRELDMPCFIDKTNGISLNPFTEFLKSALQIIIKDYSYESVFHFLKSGFSDFTEEETDRFDKYVRSLNLRGAKRYHKGFEKYQRGINKDKAQSELPFFEDIRVRLIEKLRILERPAKTASDRVRNLYDFILAGDSYNKLNEYVEFFNEANELSKAKEYAQIYKRIMELLDTIVSLVGEEEMDAEEFYRIFEAGIAEITVGTIPKNVDRIVIGDIERTRLREVKALFFAGVNEGNIPKTGDKHGIITNVDREYLLTKDMELAPTVKEAMYTQKLYLYMNMLKPVDKLFISYAGKNAEGRGITKSYLVDVVKRMFPELKEEYVRDKITADKLATERDSLRFFSALSRDYAINMLSSEEKKLASALFSIYSEDDTRNISDRITEAAFIEYVARPLSKEIVKALYGEALRASISSLEKYAACAYRYFLSEGLKLNDEAEADFTRRDLGTVYHGVLDEFSSALEKRQLNWAELTDEECNSLIEEAVAGYCKNYEQNMLNEDAQSEYMKRRIATMMLRTVKTIRFQMQRGAFVTMGHEHKFERSIQIEGGTMSFKGRIDRIDLVEQNDRIFVKITDFKTGKHILDVSSVYYGISQQLCVYMSEAIRHEQIVNPGRTIVPSGMFYYIIDNPLQEKSKGDEVEKQILKDLRLEGIFDNSPENLKLLDKVDSESGEVISPTTQARYEEKHRASTEEIAGMLEYVDKLIVEIGEDIFKGKKQLSPMKGVQDACQYCSYKGICRFDEKIPGLHARDGKETDADTVKKCVMGGGEDGIYTFS